MRGYQFGHIETYAVAGGGQRKNGDRRWSAREILDEAERRAGACAHVPVKGRAPMLIPGTCGSFRELRRRHAAAAELRESFDYTNPKTGKKTKRKRTLRKDARTLYTSVFSLPVRTEDALKNPALMREALRALRMARNYEKRRLDAAGGELAMSVVHCDEEYLHIHCYGLDKTFGRVRDLHPGEAAKHGAIEGQEALGLDKKARAKLGNQAYCDGMRAWQNEIHAQVFSRVGLLRFGPRRERLTRAEQRAREAAAEAQAESLEEAERLRAKSKAVRAAQVTQAEIAEVLDAQAKEHADKENALSERSSEVTVAEAEVAETRAKLDAERAMLRDERAAFERARNAEQVARKKREGEVARYMSDLPELLADDVVRLVASSNAPVLNPGPNFAKNERIDAVAKARASMPKSLRTSFESMWIAARDKAEEAAKAFRPDGLLGPWRDAFIVIREALRKRQTVAETGRDPEKDLTAIERAAVAVGIVAREEDPKLARAIQQAVTDARIRRQKTGGSSIRRPDRDEPEIRD